MRYETQEERDAARRATYLRYRQSVKGKASKQAYLKTYRQAHMEEAREHVRQWRAKYPDRNVAVHAAGTANAQARKLGIIGILSLHDVLRLWERQPVCVSCGKGRGLDHKLPFALGGWNLPSNLQNLCHRCNTRKGRKQAHF